MSYSSPIDQTIPTADPGANPSGPLRTVEPATPLRPPPPEHAKGIVQGRPVASVPSPARRGRWQANIEWHIAHPMEMRMYARVPHTTPGYLSRTYGVVAVGRNTRNNKVDMYMWFDPVRAPALKRT